MPKKGKKGHKSPGGGHGGHGDRGGGVADGGDSSAHMHAQKALYVALWDYNAVEDDELALARGDMVCASVDYLENSFGEWMFGENTRGRSGKFPATYVRAVSSSSSLSTDATRAKSPVYASAPLAMNANFDLDHMGEDNGLQGAQVLLTKADQSLRQCVAAPALAREYRGCCCLCC